MRRLILLLAGGVAAMALLALAVALRLAVEGLAEQPLRRPQFPRYQSDR